MAIMGSFGQGVWIQCYWCPWEVENPYIIDWIGRPLCVLCEDWHLGLGQFQDQRRLAEANGEDWFGGPYSPSARERCVTVLRRWFPALAQSPVCPLIAEFLVEWHEP